jgi:hypothetical protein
MTCDANDTLYVATGSDGCEHRRWQRKKLQDARRAQRRASGTSGACTVPACMHLMLGGGWELHMRSIARERPEASSRMTISHAGRCSSGTTSCPCRSGCSPHCRCCTRRCIGQETRNPSTLALPLSAFINGRKRPRARATRTVARAVEGVMQLNAIDWADVRERGSVGWPGGKREDVGPARPRTLQRTLGGGHRVHQPFPDPNARPPCSSALHRA